MSMLTEDIQAHWLAVQPILSIRNEIEYDMAIERLQSLVDEVGSDEQHPLYELLDTLGAVIYAYEEKHYPMPECDGVETLQFLMDEHKLGTSDLPEIGAPDTVSAILERRQELTLSHIRWLANRFQVSPAVFI